MLPSSALIFYESHLCVVQQTYRTVCVPPPYYYYGLYKKEASNKLLTFTGSKLVLVIYYYTCCITQQNISVMMPNSCTRDAVRQMQSGTHLLIASLPLRAPHVLFLADWHLDKIPMMALSTCPMYLCCTGTSQ